MIAIAGVLGVVAGCKGKTDKPAPAAPPPPVTTTIDAATATTPVTMAGVDATTPATPVDARGPGKPVTADELPDLGAGSTGAIELLAVDAPAAEVLLLLRGDPGLMVSVPTTALVRGRLRVGKRPAVFDALHAALPQAFPAPIRNAKGKAPDVDLAFRAAPVRDRYKLLGDVERKNYVVETGTTAVVDIACRRVPSDAVATAVAAAIGYVLEVDASVTYVRKPDTAPLLVSLMKTGGPIVDLGVRAAHAGEVYAMLAAAGVDVGGAACEVGAPIEVGLRKVKAGVAVAVVAALSGVAPAEDAACALPEADRATVTAMRGVVVAGKRRAAVLDAGNTASVLAAEDNGTPSGIGWGYFDKAPLAAQPNTIPLYPVDPTFASGADMPDLGGSFEPPAWTKDLDGARLAATVVEGKHASALLELPDGSFHSIDADAPRWRAVASFRFTIEPGKLRYSVTPDDPTLPPSEHELVLRER